MLVAIYKSLPNMFLVQLFRGCGLADNLLKWKFLVDFFDLFLL